MVTEFNILRLAAMPVGGMVSKPKFQEAVLFSWTGNWIVGLLATNPCDAATSPETFIEWQNLLSLNTIYNLLEAKSIPVLGGGLLLPMLVSQQNISMESGIIILQI